MLYQYFYQAQPDDKNELSLEPEDPDPITCSNLNRIKQCKS